MLDALRYANGVDESVHLEIEDGVEGFRDTLDVAKVDLFNEDRFLSFQIELV